MTIADHLAADRTVPSEKRTGTFRRALEERLLHIVSRTAPAVGEAYFPALVESLCEALECSSAFVIALPRTSRTDLVPLAVSRGGVPCDVPAFDRHGSQIETLAGDAACIHRNAIKLFPEDALIAAVGAVGCVTIPVRSADGRPNGFLGVGDETPFQDPMVIEGILRLVGPRVGAEIDRIQETAALREQTNLLRGLIDRAPDVIMRGSPGTPPRMDYVNPAFERFTGYSSEDLLEDPQLLLRIVHPDDRDNYEKLLIQGDTTIPAMWRWIRRDGTTLWTEGRRTEVYDDTGSLAAIEAIVRDITVQKQAEDQALAAERLSRLILDAIPDTVVHVNRDGAIVGGPRRGQFRFLDDATDGAPLESLLPIEVSQELLNGRLAALATGTLQTRRFTLEIDDADHFVEARIVPNADGQAIMFLRDITADEFMSRAAENQRSREELEVKAERRILRTNPHDLTFREFTVLELVAQGLTDKQVATQLGISLNTVGKHVSHILSKMEVSSRTEASVRAVQEHLLD